ncbi:hypothetical protein [Corynebacterium pseudodiphtheriticum]|uniref:Uncharacterized protein n=1 Tax=Corynebacterium pseudodiphtheriticum TaxID=37637 RepID=A0AAP4F9A3_9CORY|nr:hypothetical protein [Corynebacterium pseudodiphtheriticum]MDK4228861.1 hypothetical protein [Corynebacterium pseudodiphtheriticum]MDK4307050.1 hypothetical protein [Corynebacterium pseudodiphtheriticum]
MYILDTGPIFKFLTTDCVPELLCALGHNKIHVPKAVELEILDTPTRHRQFERAREVWPRFPDRFREIIPDDATDELRQCCQAVLGMEFEEMYAEPKDRGEHMAILHGVLRARAGEQVILVCDEIAGTNVIKQQAKVLTQAQRRGQFSPGGSIQHADTIQLLWWAIEGGGFNGSREQFLTKYKAMAALDSSMPLTAKKVGLTKSPPWPPDAKR